MSDVRADLEALISEATDLLAVPDDLLTAYGDDIYDALEGVSAVSDHIHETTRRAAA